MVGLGCEFNSSVKNEREEVKKKWGAPVVRVPAWHTSLELKPLLITNAEPMLLLSLHVAIILEAPHGGSCHILIPSPAPH